MKYVSIPEIPGTFIEVGKDRWACPRCGGSLEPDEGTLEYNCEGFEVEATCPECGRTFFGQLRLVKSSLMELGEEIQK